VKCVCAPKFLRGKGFRLEKWQQVLPIWRSKQKKSKWRSTDFFFVDFFMWLLIPPLVQSRPHVGKIENSRTTFVYFWVEMRICDYLCFESTFKIGFLLNMHEICLWTSGEPLEDACVDWTPSISSYIKKSTKKKSVDLHFDFFCLDLQIGGTCCHFSCLKPFPLKNLGAQTHFTRRLKQIR
jgi:hypothetical protein